MTSGTRTTEEVSRIGAASTRRGTTEGAQELHGRGDTTTGELAREVGAVVRLPEGPVLDPSSIDLERGDETMIINMGPQHPSTHGVLRLMLELDGEFVLRTKQVIGYLHTGMEKTAEELTYVQGATNVTRMDYLSPVINELAYSMAVEKLLGIEVPERAGWIRMLMSELNRVSSHLLWMATNGMDVGSSSMMIYGLREREMVLAFFEKTAGLRMNLNYVRPGGVAADLPDGWEDDVAVICDTIEERTYEYDELLTGQPIFHDRMEGVGNLTAEEALALGVTGPLLRSTGVPWDLRRSMPYLFYDQVEFDVIVGTYGDNFDRYAIRLNEIRESIRIVRQAAAKMPPGDYRSQDAKVTPPPRGRIDTSMEALIHHFKLFTEGFRVPAGEIYSAVESPRGELGVYLVSDGSAKPFRLHVRGPSFVNLQAVPLLLRGGMLSDAITVISTVDPVMGEVDR
jgi:NADH-quinone oxidoreductase subunit D